MAYRNIKKPLLEGATEEDTRWFTSFVKSLPSKYSEPIYDKLETLFSEGLKRGYIKRATDKLNGVVKPIAEIKVRKLPNKKYPFADLKVGEAFWWRIPDGKDPSRFQSKLCGHGSEWAKRNNPEAKFKTKRDRVGITVLRIK